MMLSYTQLDKATSVAFLFLNYLLQQRYNFSFDINKTYHLPLHPMKFFAFLMAIMVLSLSVMPCADYDFAMGNSKAKQELSKSDHQQDNPIQDACSPFCQCSCCTGFSISHLVATVLSAPTLASNPTSSFLPSDLIEVSYPIWQPPQSV